MLVKGAPGDLGHHYCFFTWWRHQMETFSALLAICAGNSPVPVNSPHKGQWRGALMFSLIFVGLKGWINNREAGDLRRYRVHYNVTVMMFQLLASSGYWNSRYWLVLRINGSLSTWNKISIFLYSSPHGQNVRHFTDDIFKCIFLNENIRISIEISLKFVPKVPIDNIPALVQIMAWRRTGDKPLSEPMLTWFIDAYMWH